MKVWLCGVASGGLSGVVGPPIALSEPRSLQHLFVLAYVEIYAFKDNPFQAHSLQQSYHPTQPFKQKKYHTKSIINVKIL
jgi:hypothetical protein